MKTVQSTSGIVNCNYCYTIDYRPHTKNIDSRINVFYVLDNWKNYILTLPCKRYMFTVLL